MTVSYTRRSLAFVSPALCVGAAGAALLALASYLVRAERLPLSAHGHQAMSPVTALCIALLAASIASLGVKRRPFTRVAAACAGVVAAASLGSQLFSGGDELSPFVASLLGFSNPSLVGRTSIATAVCVALLAADAWLRVARPTAADRLAGAAATLSGFALLGFAYGVDGLHRLPLFNTMALSTAACLFALAIAAIASDPSSGVARLLWEPSGASGSFFRRMVAMVCGMPVLGLILVRATEQDALGVGASMALLVGMTVVCLTWLVVRDGRLRVALERAREVADAERAAAEAERTARARLRDELNTELEAKLADKVAELRREVAERRTAEEAAMRASKMEAVGRLTGGIAHDFNNLLQAISGNVALLQRRMSGQDPLRKFVDNAHHAVGKGAKLTGQLLSFSRSQRLVIKPVLLRAALQDASELARLSLGSALTLDVKMPGNDAWVSADAQQLELAVLNLLMNARDAKPRSGHVLLRCVTAEGPIGSAPGARFLAVVVSDDGEGMSADDASRAGEPFFTTKPQGQGTGLGLAQVFGFARQCGGETRVDSLPGRGTTVSIVLPVAEAIGGAAEPMRAVADADAASARRPERILVIDDDDGVRAVVAQGLADAGFLVTEAVDGPSALALLAAGAPAAAVIDFMMPGMDGAEVAKRARILWPALPIVFVSGYSDTVALDRIGGASVLRKPFDIATLKRAIDSALASEK